MGRITVFSLEDCPHCRRAKGAFSARDIPYVNINIESHPSKRADMISLTDRLTVPQIFLNEDHVGGSEETLAMLTKWDDDIAAEKDHGDGDIDRSPRELYIRLVESKPDPIDERLAIPEGEGLTHRIMDFEASRTKEIFEHDGKCYTTLEITKILIEQMPRNSLTKNGLVYNNAFKGSTAVTTLQQMFQLKSRQDAIFAGLGLQHKNYIYHVCCDDINRFGDNGSYFRLQTFQTPSVLNSVYKWRDGDAMEDEPMYVIHRLGKLWSKLESRHLNEDGMVDHTNIHSDDLYWKFEEDVCELQRISLETMNEETKMAFVINVYNLMIKYASCKMGIPETSSNRTAFFGEISVNLGGHTFSLDDLEHGIMRANTRHPYKMSKQFGKKDPRRHLALTKLDCRLHFALNCGAKSCPPVKKYTAEAIEDELRLAAMAFCEQEDNVAIDEENRQVHLTKILHWYKADFAPSTDELLLKVSSYLRFEKKEKLDKLTHQGKLTVKFLEYNWSSNDINCQVFEKGVLKTRHIGLK